MINKTKIKRFYGLLHAKWYDPLRPAWVKLFSQNAEKKLFRRLKREITPKSSILELGCGTGANIGRLQQYGIEFESYIGIDFSPDMLKIALQKYGDIPNVSFVQRDITRLEHFKEKFDIILCAWVLPHIDEPSRIVNQYYEKLNKGGSMHLLFFTKPIWYIDILFRPLTSLMYDGKYVSEEEIGKMKGKKVIERYRSNLATRLEIKR